MFAIIFQELHVYNQPIMICVANILLFFMKPAEVYFIIYSLLKKSNDLMHNKNKINEIHWFFCMDKT